MRKVIFISMLVLASILLAACGGVAAPTVNANSDKPVNIQVITNPTPAKIGDMEVVFIITDAQGNPIEGAKVDVSADHAQMMGMGMNGAATDQGGGKYAINANFSMSGNWKLKVYVRKDALDYSEEIDLTVQ